MSKSESEYAGSESLGSLTTGAISVQLTHEARFVVDRRTTRRLQDWAAERLTPDPHGEGPARDQYHIQTIYFDTAASDVYHRQGSTSRAVYRLRRFGGADHAYLERRLGTAGAVMKRRTMVPLEELSRAYDEPHAPGWIGAWFARRIAVRQLSPVCQLSCRRIARYADVPTGRARLTIDELLRATPVRSARFRVDVGLPILPEQAIVSVQYDATMPSMFRQMLGRLRLVPSSISRYRLAVGALDLSRRSRGDGSAAEYALLTS